MKSHSTVRQGRDGAALIMVMCIALQACAGLPPPVVDMEGVDHAKYNRDLAACYEEANSAVEMGNAVTNCIKRKGYKILYSN
jgi:starvation-inducible outer membrane lipoprotein